MERFSENYNEDILDLLTYYTFNNEHTKRGGERKATNPKALTNIGGYRRSTSTSSRRVFNLSSS